MKIGIHIGRSGTHSIDFTVPKICKLFKFTACQVFTMVPQKIQVVKFNIEELAEVIKREKINLYIHTSYLVSPWSEKAYNLYFSLVQLRQQVNLGAQGVVFHLPKAEPREIVKGLHKLIKKKPLMSKIFLENRALKPHSTNSYETPEKLNQLMDFMLKTIPESEINFVIDTAHLYCSGIALRTYEDAHIWFSKLKHPHLIKLIHLNGNSSKTFSDRHSIAFGKKDLIWHGIDFKSSGVYYIAKWCKKYNVDIIMECDFENESKQALQLKKLIT